MPYILNNILFIHGRHFPPAGVYAGYILLVVGTIALFTNPILALLPIISGMFLSFSLIGTEVDVQNRQIRAYTRVFWTRQGHWEQMEDFPDMAALRKNLRHAMQSYSNQMITNTEVVCDVSLLTANHRERITICRYTNTEPAQERAQKLASEWNKNLRQFSPEISEASRRSRR